MVVLPFSFSLSRPLFPFFPLYSKTRQESASEIALSSLIIITSLVHVPMYIFCQLSRKRRNPQMKIDSAAIASMAFAAAVSSSARAFTGMSPPSLRANHVCTMRYAMLRCAMLCASSHYLAKAYLFCFGGIQCMRALADEQARAVV